MRTPSQMPLPLDACDSLLERFDRRLKSDFITAGLSLWTAGLRKCLCAVRAHFHARENGVYQHLMALEHDIEQGADRETLLRRIGGAKGLLMALVLSLFLTATICEDDFAAARHRRHRRRDEAIQADLDGGCDL